MNNDQLPVQGTVQAPPIDPRPGAIAPIPGAIAHQIGSGDHAQNAIVYKVILWSFIAGGAFSVVAFGHAAYKGAASPMSEVKEIWSIFAPLITLALGYLFGKSK